MGPRHLTGPGQTEWGSILLKVTWQTRDPAQPRLPPASMIQAAVLSSDVRLNLDIARNQKLLTSSVTTPTSKNSSPKF